MSSDIMLIDHLAGTVVTHQRFHIYGLLKKKKKRLIFVLILHIPSLFTVMDNQKIILLSFTSNSQGQKYMRMKFRHYLPASIIYFLPYAKAEDTGFTIWKS